MGSAIRFLVLGVLLASGARAELLLTPTVLELQGDGVKYKCFAFSDGEKTVKYRAPSGWSYQGSSTQLTMRPPEKPQAEATITKFPIPKPQPLDEERLKKLVEEAMALIPKGSENITIVSQERNPVVINQKETFQVIVSYNLFGQPYNRSVLFMDRGREHMRFQLVCRSSDFTDLHRAFLHSQFSWENL